MAHRFEYKYYVSEELLPELRRRLLPFVEFDPFAARNEEHEYTVRSAYFDTPTLREYHEKIAGLEIRKKLRIRVYDTLTEDSTAFLEIKRKRRQSVSKDRAMLLHRDVPALLATGNIEQYVIRANGSTEMYDSARKFLYHMRSDHLRPVLLVTYDREAFVGKFDPNFRCTFDKRLRFSSQQSLDDLFRETDLRPALQGAFILEVKFQNSVPVWLSSTISDLRLSRGAFSKYCIGIDTVMGTNGFPAYFTHPRRLRIDTLLKV
jgi:SPX domain protein involved in polyphosphate accumulation